MKIADRYNKLCAMTISSQFESRPHRPLNAADQLSEGCTLY